MLSPAMAPRLATSRPVRSDHHALIFDVPRARLPGRRRVPLACVILTEQEITTFRRRDLHRHAGPEQRRNDDRRAAILAATFENHNLIGMTTQQFSGSPGTRRVVGESVSMMSSSTTSDFAALSASLR